MANVVIVAIPEKDDYVWKISSEKVPHMTILSLGEQEIGPATAQIESYLSHAVETMLFKFGMSVERRDTLGPKEADVLLFDKSFTCKNLKDFRDALLKEPHILELFNGSVQFPEWIPHLTLGFPETPAKPDERDYPGTHWVNFDKIALWVDDFDGPEFDLRANDPAMMMSGLQKNRESSLAILERNGIDLLHDRVFDESKVKRKGGRFAKKAESNGDAEWMDPSNLRDIHGKILEASSDEILAAKRAVAEKYGLKPGEEITNNPKAQKELLTNTVAILNKAAKTMGVSPSGSARINFAVNKDGTGIYKSAVLNNDVHRVAGRRVVRTAEHSIDEVSGLRLDQKVEDIDVLQFGKLGMKWGVRRPRDSSGHVFGPVKSADAAKAAEIKKQIGRKGNLSKLSNDDIQKLTTRINLENSLARAATESSKITKANTLVKRGLDLGQTANSAIKFYNSDAGQLLRATVGKDAHGGKHNKLNQPIGKLADSFAGGGKKGGGKRKK